MFFEVKYTQGSTGSAYIRKHMSHGSNQKIVCIEKLGALDSLMTLSNNFVDFASQHAKDGDECLFKFRYVVFDELQRRAIMSVVKESSYSQFLEILDPQNAKVSKKDYKEALGNLPKVESTTRTLSKTKSLTRIKQYADFPLFNDASAKLTPDDFARLRRVFSSHLDKDFLNEIAPQYQNALGAVSRDPKVSDESVNSEINFENKELKDEYDHAVHRDLMQLPQFEVVVAAAGIGSRMGSDIPKQYLRIGDRTIVEHTVLKMLSSPYVSRVIVVVSPDDLYYRLTMLSDLCRVKVTYGGKERFDSVLNGLKEAKGEWVMVHDAARPLITHDDIENLICHVAKGYEDGYSGGILALDCADTLKELTPESKPYAKEAKDPMKLGDMWDRPANSDQLEIARTVDRSNVMRAQTPQMFKREELISALNICNAEGKAVTDEASALELCGKKVLMVKGNAFNFKITTPADLMMAKALMSYYDGVLA